SQKSVHKVARPSKSRGRLHEKVRCRGLPCDAIARQRAAIAGWMKSDAVAATYPKTICGATSDWVKRKPQTLRFTGRAELWIVSSPYAAVGPRRSRRILLPYAAAIGGERCGGGHYSARSASTGSIALARRAGT